METSDSDRRGGGGGTLVETSEVKLFCSGGPSRNFVKKGGGVRPAGGSRTLVRGEGEQIGLRMQISKIYPHF